MIHIEDRVEDRIINRMYGRLNKLFFPLARILGEDAKYYVCGNSCKAATPNDYDIYSVDKPFNLDVIEQHIKVKGYDIKVICKTKNALTISIDGVVVQFCSYYKDSLEELVESFDYAHIQVGVKVESEWCMDDDDIFYTYASSCITQVYVSSAYIESHTLGTTWFTGSEYPLSSLIRHAKYNNRGNFVTKSESTSAIIQILTAIIQRGFRSYEDFKDQLAAVDLLLLSEEEHNAASELYSVACSRGLVDYPNVDMEEI